MFQDEAVFGRIGKTYKCWAFDGERPTILQQKIREFRYLFGAVDPMTGDSCFMIYSHCDTITMNHFLKQLSEMYIDDYILLPCDNAGWHKSKDLVIPHNIEFIYIPPYTPEMNPIEQIWDELREKFFANEFFETIDDVIERLCVAVQSLEKDTISSITFRRWMCEQFN
jgi:putative transposase